MLKNLKVALEGQHVDIALILESEVYHVEREAFEGLVREISREEILVWMHEYPCRVNAAKKF